MTRNSSKVKFLNNLAEANLQGDQYFEQVKRNFTAFKRHIVKKNDQLRSANLRKEAQVSPNGGSGKKKAGLAGLIKES